jgi:uncharacterized protein (TIGR02246 family)
VWGFANLYNRDGAVEFAPRETETMTDNSDLLASVLRRLEALEDERAIQTVLTRYGFAVDSGDADATANIYTEDCHIDIDAVAFMDGSAGARSIVTSEAHQAIMPNCAHVMGPFVVQLDGDKATATGYATVHVKEDGQVRVWRQSYGRWELVKQGGTWRVAKRTSRSTGRDDCQAVLNAAL